MARSSNVVSTLTFLVILAAASSWAWLPLIVVLTIYVRNRRRLRVTHVSCTLDAAVVRATDPTALEQPE